MIDRRENWADLKYPVLIVGTVLLIAAGLWWADWFAGFADDPPAVFAALLAAIVAAAALFWFVIATFVQASVDRTQREFLALEGHTRVSMAKLEIFDRIDKIMDDIAQSVEQKDKEIVSFATQHGPDNVDHYAVMAAFIIQKRGVNSFEIFKNRCALIRNIALVERELIMGEKIEPTDSIKFCKNSFTLSRVISARQPRYAEALIWGAQNFFALDELQDAIEEAKNSLQG